MNLIQFYFLCSEKTNTAVGCMDSSRRRELLLCSSTSWQGNFNHSFLLMVQFFSFMWLLYSLTCIVPFDLQNFEMITCRVQSKNKDQVSSVL